MNLSIVIPVFKVEDYIHECLASVYQADVDESRFEVIVVNDGTPDHSMDIVRRFGQEHQNLCIIEQENQGLSMARTNGLLHAGGDYVWFADSDDYLAPGSVSAALETIENVHPDVVVTPLHWFEDGGNPTVKIDIQIKEDKVIDGKAYLKSGMPSTGIQRCIIRRELLGNPFLFFPPSLLHEDAYFGRVLFYEASSVCILKAPLYYYRIRKGSIMTRRGIQSSYDLVSIFDLLSEYATHNVTPGDGLWFRRNVFMGTLAESYSISRHLIGTSPFRSFQRKNRKKILAEYRRCQPASSRLIKRSADMLYLLFPHLFCLVKGDVRYIDLS